MRRSLQNLRQPLLPMVERSLQTPLHKSRSECPQPSKGQRELDRIAYPRPFHALTRLRFNPMPVAERRERPVHLLVAKMAVPFELGDARHPAHALWHPANRIKADQDLRPHARCHTAKSPRRLRCNGPWTTAAACAHLQCASQAPAASNVEDSWDSRKMRRPVPQDREPTGWSRISAA